MDVEINRLPCDCDCPCTFCGSESHPSIPFPRTLKRKLVQMDRNAQRDVARVDIEIEAAALREALASQLQTIQGLYSELEEERAAASTAASEAMSMILRLQREKAAALMDARQFKSFAEEKMSHDQQEIALLEELLFKREQHVQFLNCEVQAYRHRLLSYGIEPEFGAFLEITTDSDLKYANADASRSPGPVHRLPSITEKAVIGSCYSPRFTQRTFRRHSIDSFGCPSFPQEFEGNEFPSMEDQVSDTHACGRDDMSDRVYTIDAVQGGNDMFEDASMNKPREFLNRRHVSSGTVDEEDIKKIYMRLQVLEENRSTAKGTDKKQELPFNGISQQMCKEVIPERINVQKPSFINSFSIIFLFKWVASLIIWKKKSPKIKYPFGLSGQRNGLLILLDKYQRKRLKRCITRMPI